MILVSSCWKRQLCFGLIHGYHYVITIYTTISAMFTTFSHKEKMIQLWCGNLFTYHFAATFIYNPWSWKIFPTLLCYCCYNYYFTFIWFHQKYNNCYYTVIIAENMHFHFSITITIIILPWHWSLLLIATKSTMLWLWQKYFSPRRSLNHDHDKYIFSFQL